MGAKYELDVTIERGQADKRQALVSSIELGLCNGARIQAGTYRVTIERLSVKQRLERAGQSPTPVGDRSEPHTIPECTHGYTSCAACPFCVAAGLTVEFEPEEGEF